MSLKPPPIEHPLVDETRKLTPQWQEWIMALWRHVRGLS